MGNFLQFEAGVTDIFKNELMRDGSIAPSLDEKIGVSAQYGALKLSTQEGISLKRNKITLQDSTIKIHTTITLPPSGNGFSAGVNIHLDEIFK